MDPSDRFDDQIRYETKIRVDFRKLSAVMKSEMRLVPPVGIFCDLRDSSVFTTLYLFQGYWQIDMDGA